MLHKSGTNPTRTITEHMRTQIARPGYERPFAEIAAGTNMSTVGTFAERMRVATARPDYVRSFAETAVIANMSKDTLRRIIAKGDGPKVTRLSARKVGIRDSDREAWLSASSASGSPGIPKGAA